MITKDRMKWFLAPDGVVTGNEGPLPSKGMSAVNEPAIENEPEVTEPVTEAKPPVVTVDAAELAKSFGDVLAERFPKAPTPAEKTVDTLTPEESKRLLNVWEPTPEWLKKYDNLDTRAEAIAEQRDGMVKHVDTISQFRLREIRKEMEGKFGPALTYMEEARERETVSRFNVAYPQLADPALGGLIKTVTTDLQKQGKKFTVEKDLFDEVAKGVEAVIKVGNPDFKLTAGSSPAKPTKKGSSPNSIPVTTPGAGGGTAAIKPATGNKPRGLAIFD